jgi:activator of HSP90 ATPase
MAKFGETDQRWIVKERDDGTNVNAWHWREQDYTPWARQYLQQALGKLDLAKTDKHHAYITKVDKIEGDVTVQARKQKKFALYELELTLSWEAEAYDAKGATAHTAKGKIKIPDLSEETYDDLELTVLCDDEDATKRPLKEVVRKEGAARVKGACVDFVKALKARVYAGAPEPEAKPAAVEPQRRSNAQYVCAAPAKSSLSEIVIKYSFNPPVPVIYETMLDSQRIAGATASDASISTEVGGRITMFSGAVEGENVELKPFDGSTATIVWKWRFSTWAPGHYSTVTIELEERDGSTRLTLRQVGVPEEEKERTEKGWTGLLFDRLKGMLGGSVLK